MKQRFSILCISFFLMSGFAQQEKTKVLINTKLHNKILNYIQTPSWVSNGKALEAYKNQEEDLISISNYYSKQPTTQEKVIVSLFLGAYYYTVAENYYKAEELFLYCFENKGLLNNQQKYALFNSLADVEKIQNNFLNAIYFYESNLELALKTNNKHEESNAYREIGVIYRDIDKLDKAEKYLLRSKNMLEDYNIKIEDKIWTELHLARLYRLQKKIKKSKTYYDFALSLANENNVNYIKNYIYLDYAEYWLDSGDITKAKNYCRKVTAKQNTELLETNDFLKLLAYQLLGNIDLSQKDTINAIKNYKLSFDISRNVQAIKTAQQTADKILLLTNPDQPLFKEMTNHIISLYDKQDEYFSKSRLFAKQLDDIYNLEKKLEFIDKRSSRINLSIAIIAVITIILAVLIYLLRKNSKIIKKITQKLLTINEKAQKNNAKLAQVNEDLNRFSSIVAHDIKSSIVGLQYSLKKTKNDNTFESIEEQKQINLLEKNVNQLYEYIDYLMFAAKNANISNLVPQIIDFQEILLQSVSSFQNKINFSFNDNTPKFKGYKIQLFQLIKALTDIAIKNASDSPKLDVHIEVTKQSDKLNLVFTDNGPRISWEEIQEINQEIENVDEITLQSKVGINYMVCKKIISNYNGKMKITSSKELGNQKVIQLIEK